MRRGRSMTAGAAALALLLLPGCASVLQGVYDESARDSCRNGAVGDERRACERDADEAAMERWRERRK